MGTPIRKWVYLVIVFQSGMSPLQDVPFAVEFLKKASEPLSSTTALRSHVFRLWFWFHANAALIKGSFC